MTFHNLTSDGGLFVAFLIAGTLFYALSMKQGWASKSLKRAKRIRVTAGYGILTLGIGLLILGLNSAPVPAKEIFVVPSNGGYDFYQVDSSIQNPNLTLADPIPQAWPGLESDGTEGEFSFMDTTVKDSSLILDPGFRVSLTHRIMKVAGRIVWARGFEEIALLTPLNDQKSLDMGKLNVERLTGVYELAWLSAYESQMSVSN